MSYSNAHGYERAYLFGYQTRVTHPPIVWRRNSPDLSKPKEYYKEGVAFVRRGALLSELSDNQRENIIFGESPQVLFTKH